MTMARLQLLLPVFAALFVVVVASNPAQIPKFVVTGSIYCDTCRAGFETSASEYIEGAKVKLECKHFLSGAVEHSVDGVTDKNGKYNITLENEHGEEICEVVLVESPLAGCKEMDASRIRARVLLSDDGGLVSAVRMANPLSFLKDEPLPICGTLLQKYGLGTDN